MIDPLNVWKSTLKDLPKVDNPIWAINFANWYGDRIQNIEPDPTKLQPAGFVFIFNRVLFASLLSALPPTPSQPAGIAMFAAAWEAAILTTVFPATLSASSGTVVPPPSPATTFSVVNSVILDPASVAAGKAKILELASAPLTGDATESQFPVKFREATLKLTITVTGLDSTPTPAGPLPLTAPLVPLI